MGIRVNSTQTPAATAATYTVRLGAHVAGDFFLVELTQDGGGTEISFGNATVTITNASPAVATYSGADIFSENSQIVLTTTGSLPSGLSVSTVAKYYVKDLDTATNTFKLSSTPGGAAINTASAGSGTHTAHLHSKDGWYMLGIQARASTVSRHVLAGKFAASSSEANPTFYGSNDEWLGACHVYRDVDDTWSLGALVSGTDYARSEVSTGTSHTMPSVTTPDDGRLLVYSGGFDGPGAPAMCRMSINATRGINRAFDTNNANIYTCSGQVQQESAGASPNVTIYKTQSGWNGNLWTLAIPNKPGGALQPDIRPNVTELYFYGNFGNADPAISWQAPSSFAASIGGIVCSPVAPTVSTGSPAMTAASWGSHTTLSYSTAATTHESPAGSGVWSGGTKTISSTDFTGKIVALQWYRNDNDNNSGNMTGTEGSLIGFHDGTNWEVFQFQSRLNSWVASYPYGVFIAPGYSTPYASFGTLNWSAITRIGFFMHRIGSTTAAYSGGIKNLALLGTTAITGGGPNRPAKWSDFAIAMRSWGGLEWAQLPDAGVQTIMKSSVQIGDGGANTTYFDSSAESAVFPPAYGTTAVSQMKWNATAGAVVVSVKAGADDTINLKASGLVTQTEQAMSIDAASSASADYGFVGQTIVGFDPVWNTSVPCIGVTYSQCGEIDAKGSDWTDCTIADTISTDAAIAFSEDGGSMTRCTIDVTGTSALYHLELGTAVTAISLTDVTFTGTPGTDKVHVRKTTGTVTITIDGTTSLVAGDVTSEGASVSIVAPTLERGQEFTGLVAGSFVRVVTSDDVTQKFEDVSSSTTESWDDATSGSVGVDYSVMKAGLVPIRVANITLTGAVGSGVVTVPIDQVVDRGYAASSGLTINTNTYANATTKLFGLTTGSTTQNWYSYLIEQWIALGNTGEAFANKDFPLESTGPTSFTAKDGWRFDLTTYPDSIANLSGGGLRYLNTSGNVTDVWAAIRTTGVPSTLTVRYKHQSTGAWSSASAADDMDELIKVIEDPNGDGSYADGFNRSGTMIVRVQGEGYDMAEVDVVDTFGTLDNYLYSIAPVPTANGIATGNPTLNGAPAISVGTYTESGKTFGIKIVDGVGGNSAEDLMRWIRYAQGQGGTFQGREANDWHDLIQTNGTAFKTVRGTIYGPTATKGVVVYQNDGVTLHPDFNLFTADDGTTYSPPVVANAEAAVLADTRVQLYNVTQDVEIDNDFIAGTSYSYTITTEADVGDTLRLRVAKKGRRSDVAFAVWSASGVTFLVSQPEDTIYTAWGIDGETVTEYALDGTNMQIDADDVDGISQKVRLGAFYSYALTTEIGIRDFFGAVTAISPAAIRVNVDVATLRVQNINPTTALRFTDIDVRLYCSDGSSIIAEDSYSIHNDYSGVPDVTVVNVDGGSVITGDISDIPSYVPSAAGTAAAILAAAAAAPIYADVRKVNDVTVAGSGIPPTFDMDGTMTDPGDPWRAG